MHIREYIKSSLDEILDNLMKDYKISPREREICSYVIRGYTNYKISDQLYISMKTVKFHIANIIKKIKEYEIENNIVKDENTIYRRNYIFYAIRVPSQPNL